ncbi:MAG: hypothetical protein J3K34DRAFT_405029 [Monoraphidium minutum]|nr:MAG: hypothetical protein J3K34DRAFT_405029 [Monoraphidium minutum]
MDLFQWEALQPEGGATKTLSEEEIARYAVDPSLPELERAVLYLSQGYAVQQRMAIDSLPALIKARGRAAFDALREPLEAALDGLDVEAEVAVAEAWAAVVRGRMMPPPDLAECLLPSALAALGDNREDGKEVCDAWAGVLSELLPAIGRDAALRDVLPLALSKGCVDGSVASRVLCCRLLGAAAPCLRRGDVEAAYSAKMVALCQDTDYQVRVAACQQLPALARCLGEQGLRRSLLEELGQLLEDEEVQVRQLRPRGKGGGGAAGIVDRDGERLHTAAAHAPRGARRSGRRPWRAWRTLCSGWARSCAAPSCCP